MDKTIKLYQQDVYMREWNSFVLAAITEAEEIKALGGIEVENSFCLIFDKTAFFPEGGGQPSDKGFILKESPVIYVFEKEGIVYHQIKFGPKDFPSTNIDQISKLVGTSVTCRLDWSYRFSNMQRHCGEHILSAVFYDLYGGVNRGFHMGEDYMTIDINLEEKPEFTQFTDEMMLQAEWEANHMIWDNLPVSVRFFDKREDAENIPMRKALAIDEDIILVCVGDESNPAGCVACCGTHPHTTGEVGLIKLYRWENYKGMTRITFDAGSNALTNFRDMSDIFKNLCLRYSADPHSLIDKINREEQKNKQIRQELYELKKIIIAERAKEVIKALDENEHKTIIREYMNLKTDDLLALGRLLPENMPHLIVLISPTENTVLLFSGGTQDCGKIVKDNAGVWGGKGGGRAKNARAMFPSNQNLNCFIDFLQKAYK